MEKKPTDSVSRREIVITAAVAAALIVLGLLWPRILAGREALVETYYSNTVYQAIRIGFSAATSLVPFSIAELLLYGIAISVTAQLIALLVRLILRRTTFRRLLSFLASLALTAGILLNLFYVTWGFNYFRQPLSERMGLTVCARSADELEQFVLNTAAEASALRETLHEDENGVFCPAESRRAIFNALPDAYDALAERFPAVYGSVTRAKAVLWSKGLSWQGISGVYIGLTAEPNVNVDQPPLLLYEAAAHEMAHQLGIASENEAEFSAYLACLSSDDPNVRYSGLIFALIIGGNALCSTDAERYRAAAETYGDAIWRDLADYDAYWDSFEGAARESADKRNDAYLKHNSQESGIKSYGESVDLMLAYAAEYGG